MAKTSSKDIRSQHTACAALSYWLIGIIWYFVDEKMRTNDVKFHVKQGLVLLMLWVALHLVANLLFFISVFGFSILVTLVQLALLVLTIIGTIKAINGEKYVLPVVGGLTKYFTF